MSIVVRHMKWLAVIVMLLCCNVFAYGQTTQSITDVKLRNAEYICANQTSGEYTIDFRWNGALPSNSNVFTMELSSPSGDFTSGTTTLATLQSNASSRLLSMTFRVTAGMSSNNYRIRIKSSDPVVEGVSAPISIHYTNSADAALTLNSFISPVELCQGQGRTLAITDGVNASSYIWYKDGVEIAGQTGRSITVTEVGTYKVSPNLGRCGINLGSNDVKVIAASNNSSVSILGGSPQEKCKGGTAELEAQVSNPITTENNYTYEWYKDGVKQSATTKKITISDFGSYYVIATPSGGCSIQSEAVSVVEKSGSGLITIPGGNTQLKCAGNTLALSVSTQLTGTLQWYKNSTAIANATSSTYSVTDIGSYYVTITEASGCIYTSNIVAVQERSDVDTADIEWLGVRGSVLFFYNYRKPTLELNITSASAFNIKWYRDGALVQDDTKRTYQTEAGGLHKAEVYDTCGNKLAEKELNVIEPRRFNVKINYSGEQSCTGSEIKLKLTSLEAYDQATNTTDVVRESDYGYYTFEWTKDNQVFQTNVFEITIDNSSSEGIYRLKVNGAFNSQEIDIKERPKGMPENLVIRTNNRNTNTLKNKEGLMLIPYNGDNLLQMESDKTYKWYHKDQLVKEADSDITYTIPASEIDTPAYNEALGEYKLVIEYTDSHFKEICGRREATINIGKWAESNKVPNVVILSSDTPANAKWFLPETDEYYNVKVTIYSQSGKVVFSANEYKNDWPSFSSTEDDKGRAVIYFYVIEKMDGSTETGTITVLN
ncbi:MAG: gliding motility-associated C-terminal domain-containing protein [Capnocytophaga sp.]|nr:gliding motility-associated C-terminal domain-containing protein [Capnocytophaga sp.]